MPPARIISALINFFCNIQHCLNPILGAFNVLFKCILVCILVFVWCLNVLSFIATYVSISLLFEINKAPDQSPECHTKKEPDYTNAQFLAYIYLLDKKLEKSQELELF